MQITAYKNTSKFYSYRIQRDGVDMDLEAEGVSKIQIVDQGKGISTLTGDITFSGSVMNVRWGALDLPAGEYSPTWYIYSPTSPEGEVLYGPEVNPISLTLIEDERPHLVTVSATVTTLELSGPSKPIKSIIVNGETINFKDFGGSLEELSSYPLSLIGGASIAPKLSLPTQKTFSFHVQLPNGVVSKFTQKWLL